MFTKKYLPFKIQYDIEQRKAKSQKFLVRNQQCIPLIIEPLNKSSLSPLENGKFSVQKSKTVTYIKEMLITKVDPMNQKGVFIFLGKKLLHEGSITIGELYEHNHDPDGFLYLHFSQSNPF